MSRIDVMIGKARVKSTKSQIRISYKGETIKLSKRKIKVFFLKLAAFFICLHVIGVLTDKAWEKIDYQIDVVSARKQVCVETENLLSSNNLNTEPGKDGNWCNDYSDIEGLSKNDIYGFYNYCGYKETEKVLKQLGYFSWENFLIRNGYYDNSGAPSFEVWENYAEAESVEQLKEQEALENGRGY